MFYLFAYIMLKKIIDRFFNKSIHKTSVAHSKNPKLICVYTDKEGVNYYGFKNPIELPSTRTIAVERATRYANMFITEQTLKSLFKEIKEAGNKQDWIKVFSIIQEIDFRLEFLSEENSLLEISSYYFIEENESLNLPDEEVLKNKIGRWKNDEDARAFFLGVAMGFIQKYSGISLQNVMNYLRENERNEKRIYQHISGNH